MDKNAPEHTVIWSAFIEWSLPRETCPEDAYICRTLSATCKWIGRIEVSSPLFNILWVPGWAMFYVLHNGPAARWSDFLIPVLSSVVWGWLAVFVLRVIEYAWSHEHWAALTRVTKCRFAAECGLILSIVTCVGGMYLNSDPLYLTGFFASCVLFVAVLALSVYSLLPRSIT